MRGEIAMALVAVVLLGAAWLSRAPAPEVPEAPCPCGVAVEAEPGAWQCRPYLPYRDAVVR